MTKKKNKYYTVWKGHQPGVFDSWPECQLQIKNYSGAQFMSFSTKAQAENAFKGNYKDFEKKSPKSKVAHKKISHIEINPPDLFSIAVDAASSGNPGTMEYRGVDPQTNNILFHKGPFEMGTNNVGEFLAIVHGLAFLKKQQSKRALYTDSVIAMGWVKKKVCNTKLKPTEGNKILFDLIRRAERWLNNNNYSTKILKWDTKSWGEIPADFGRK